MLTAESAAHQLLSETPGEQYGDSTYELLPNAESFFADLVREIDAATSSVDLQFYTFEADAAGIPIAEALARASKRGIRVRIMIDDYINLAHNDSYIRVPRLDRQLQHSIVEEWRATNALLDKLRAQGVGVKMINPLGFLHHKVLQRDHKKMAAIDADVPDKAISYMGGINPSDHNAEWNDFMVKMRGPMTTMVQAELDATWDERNQGGIQDFGGGLFVNDSKGNAQIIPLAIALIEQAKNRIVIESPYLWGKPLLRALAKAALRHVDVSVIVPLNNNHALFVPTERSLARLAQAGVTVYQYVNHDGMTHTKALLADGVVLFGSNNFNMFLSGRIGEAAIATADPSVVGQIGDFLDADIAASRKFKAKPTAPRR